MSDSLVQRSAESLIASIHAGETTAAEVMQAHLDRVGDDRWGSFLATNADAAMTRAREIDAAPTKPPLAGIPIAIKDALSTRDLVTTSGSKILKGFRPVYSATCVERLEAAGAIVIAKTNMDEFAMGSSTENSAYHPTKNPWDISRVPGGSSGGSAASVAAFQTPWSLGSDTGGSIRQPAALCGIVGMKPTFGAVSRYGLIAFGSSLDQVGPFARNVRDAALCLQQIIGHDPRDSTSINMDHGIALPTAERLDGVRVGVVRELLGDGIEPGVRTAVETSLARVQELGGTLVDIELPHSQYGLSTYYLLAPAECSTNLARFDGIRYGTAPDGVDDILEHYERVRGEGFGPEVKRRIMLGTFALSSGYYDDYYARAQRIRTLIVRDFEAAFAQCDLVASPTSPNVAFPMGERTADPLSMYLADICTIPVSLAGIPSISIPCGLSDGLPVGLQLSGPAFSENRLLDAAHALEQAIAFDTTPPGVFA